MASSLGTQAILTKANFTLLPLAIRHADQWITWDAGDKRPGRYEKWQKDVASRRHIDDVMPELGDGLGLARVMSDGFAVLDLDKVAATPRDRKSLVAWAQPIVARALKCGYVEWSHSGRGLHIIMRDVPQDWQRKRSWRADDGSGYDWIAGENLCHLTMDSLDHLGGTICVPASEMIALLPQPVEAVPAVTSPAPRVLATRFEIAPSDARKHGYGENAMQRLIGEFSQAGEGARNKGLNWISYRLGQLDAAGTIADAQRWLDVVQSTAGAIGLGNREIVSTMRSGYEAGLLKPADIDWRDDEPRERHADDAPVQSVASDAVVAPEASGSVTAASPEYVVGREGITLADLQNKQFRPLRWIVADIAPEGAILIAAKPKARKSWLALNLSIAIASGGKALGRYDVDQGSVLYLDLEGNQRRIQSRVRQILGVNQEPWPANVEVFTEWSRGDDAVHELRQWLLRHEDASAIVVDLLHEIRPPMDPREDRYAYDRNMLVSLNRLAEEFHVALFVVHHTRKMKGEDVFEEISGTLGLTGAAATLWVLSKAQDGTVTLNLQGRDLQHDEPLAMEWDSYLSSFRVTGLAAEVAVSETRRRIIEYLSDDEARAPRDIAEMVETSSNTVVKMLQRMLTDGVVEKSGYGKYRLIRRK